MASFHVYVEGADEPGPEAIRHLAEAISERYGLPTADLIARMTKGRFRVKANVDRETADKYQRDLTAIGARIVIEEARLQSSPSTPVPRASTPPPIAAARTSTAQAVAAPRTSTAQAVAAPRTSTAQAVAAPRPSTPPPISAAPPRASVPPPIVDRQSAPVFASGLSAAFSTEAQQSDLGALGALGSGGGIALSALDGSGDEEVMENQFSVPAPAARPKAATAAPAAKAPRPKDVPVEVDMFSAPDGADAEMKMEIAPDELEHRARRRMSTPPAATPIATAGTGPASATPAMRRSTPSMQPVNVPIAVVARPRGKLGVLGEPQVRFALGVLVAILLGFVPAHVSAGMREHSVYGSIDSKVETVQASVDTIEDYNALDAFRNEQLNQKHSERRMIAFTSLLIWAAAAGALGYVWFRRIPWDRLDAA